MFSVSKNNSNNTISKQAGFKTRPVFAVLLKAYSCIFGDSLVSLRMFSAALLSLLFFFALFPLRRLMGEKCAVVAAVLFLTTNYNVYFGLEIRPTILAYVVTTGVIVSFILKKKDVLKKYLLSGVAVTVLYIPWLIGFLSQFGSASDSYWELRRSLFYGASIALFGVISNNLFPVADYIVLMFLFFLPVISIVLIIDMERFTKARHISELISKEEIVNKCPCLKKLLYMTLVLVISITGFWLITQFVLPIFTERYFYIYSGGAIVVLAGLSTFVKGKKVPAILCSFISMSTASSLWGTTSRIPSTTSRLICTR